MLPGEFVFRVGISTDYSERFYLDMFVFYDAKLLRENGKCKLFEMKNYDDEKL